MKSNNSHNSWFYVDIFNTSVTKTLQRPFNPVENEMKRIYLELQPQDTMFQGQSVTKKIPTSIYVYAHILLDSNSEKWCGNLKLALEQALLCILCSVFGYVTIANKELITICASQGYKYLYLTPQDYKRVSALNSVHCEHVEDEGESR
jgi:hypothetical protein